MTWSIVARDPVTGAFGVAVATRFFAVGALCAHADGGIGGLATQALINPTFGARGLRLLRQRALKAVGGRRGQGAQLRIGLHVAVHQAGAGAAAEQRQGGALAE